MTTDKEQRSHEDRDVEVKQNPSAPREERVLKLLDSEIENVRDTETRHGWTSWGLIGAIIASLWLLSEEFKFGNLRLEVIATAVLIFSAFIDSLRWFAYLAWQVSAPKSEQVRFRWSNEFFSGSELTYFTEILRSAGLIAVAFLLAPKWWFSLLTFSLAYVWYLFLAISWLVLTKSEFAIRQGLTKIGAIFMLIFVIPAFISCLAYLSLAPIPSMEVIASYRAGGLLVAISYLILSLAIVTKDSPILQSLIGIRRNIVFSRVDISSAVSQAEIALRGMQVPDAIQRDIHPILALVDSLNEATEKMIDQVQTMRTHLPKRDDSPDVVSAKLRILTTHRDTCEFILRSRTSAMEELNSKFQQLMKRRQRIQAVIPEASEFFNELDSGMKTILNEADARFNHYVEQANQYDEELNAVTLSN